MLAILDPFSGISGDMVLGALVNAGLPSAFVEQLPERLGLADIGVRVTPVMRASLAATHVGFSIPPQPHGRHLDEIQALLDGAALPPEVRLRCGKVFAALAQAEAEIHGLPVSEVHLHEVGAVDAILDVVGVVWGFAELGVHRVLSGPVALGDGFVRAAHGVLPVPAPAALKLLQGLLVRPGPEGAGELVTPTGAALLHILSEGPPPPAYVPTRVGYGAGSKDLIGRPNVLRLILAESTTSGRELLAVAACDLDDMTGEATAAAVDLIREAGALDVWLTSTVMKKGRPGIRLELLCVPGDLTRLEGLLFRHTTTLGVRHWVVERASLARDLVTVEAFGKPIRVKVAQLPGGGRRAKAEHDDVSAVARLLGKSVAEVAAAAVAAAERQLAK